MTGAGVWVIHGHSSEEKGEGDQGKCILVRGSCGFYMVTQRGWSGIHCSFISTHSGHNARVKRRVSTVVYTWPPNERRGESDTWWHPKTK